MLVTQSHSTLCNLLNCSPPGSSVHGILQAKIMEWLAISFSRGSSQARDRTQVSCIAGRCFTICTAREAQRIWENFLINKPISIDPVYKSVWNNKWQCTLPYTRATLRVYWFRVSIFPFVFFTYDSLKPLPNFQLFGKSFCLSFSHSTIEMKHEIYSYLLTLLNITWMLINLLTWNVSKYFS